MFIVILVLAGIAAGAWSLSGPAGSTPDEDFHLASIWCGQGTDAHCAKGASSDRRTVPEGLVTGAQCFATKPAESADCLGTDYGDDPKPTFETDRGNFRGDYPPVYYAVMHTFVGDDISKSVLTMRAFNVLTFLVIVAAVMALVPPMLRRVTAWTFVLASVPLGIWMISSINPSGWTIVSAGTLWVCLYALPDAVGWRRPALVITAILTATMGVGSRTDSCLFTLMAVALVFIMRPRDVLRSKTALATGSVIGVASLFVFLTAKQSAAAVDAFGAQMAPSDLSSPALLWNNVQNLPVMWTGVWGGWPLGWVDTPLPPVVLVGSLLPWAALLFVALRNGSRRQMTAMALLAAALVTYPLFLVTRSHLLIGQGVQPRYLVPIVVMLTGMTLLVTKAGSYVPSRGQIALVTVALGAANSFALHTAIRRYVTGLDVVSIDLDAGREWWWNLPITPMAVWMAGSLAFAAVVWLVLNTFSPLGDGDVAGLPVDGAAPGTDAGHRRALVDARTAATEPDDREVGGAHASRDAGDPPGSPGLESNG